VNGLDTLAARAILDLGMKKTLAIAAAWLPFLALWQLFAMQNGSPFLRALPYSLYAIATAAVLGLLVTRACARLPWPNDFRASFYLAHVVAAAAYAGIWAAAMYAFVRVMDDKPVPQMFVSLWILEGIWLYAIVAGFSYAILTQRRAAEAEKGLALARLDTLRSRLHPHFLFNALHTVGALVRHDPAEAEGAVEKLGDMLRYTLRDGGGDAVPFAEEWEFTRRYLEFEQLRYGDRLRVTSDIDPRALTCSAPSFALQTLVENSVRHSIAPRPEGGRVEIRASVGGDRLQIRVRDHVGVAAPGHPTAPEAGAATHGYGLSALRERLETVYGSRLEVSRNDTGFQVEFSVPCSLSGVDDDE
jgi:signal transduction histidine kinase